CLAHSNLPRLRLRGLRRSGARGLLKSPVVAAQSHSVRANPELSTPRHAPAASPIRSTRSQWHAPRLYYSQKLLESWNRQGIETPPELGSPVFMIFPDPTTAGGEGGGRTRWVFR